MEEGLIKVFLLLAYLTSLYFSIFWFIVFFNFKNNLKKEEKEKIVLKIYPFVSVIIPAYNEQDTIKDTLISVLQLDYPKHKLEIVVVNDGSTDNTQKIVKKIIKENKDFNISLINQKNSGKAAALNNALSKIKGEFFACLDADSIVNKETLKRMLCIYQNESDDLAIVTPAMKVREPKKLLEKIQRLEYLFILFIVRLMGKLNTIYVAPGPFSLYRTSIIKNLGGFDENNLTEDQEIAFRIQKNNYSIKHCYNAYVHTSAPKTVKGLYNQRNRWFKGALQNIFKYKEMIFNKRYGDFGIMQITSNIILFFLGILTLFFSSYYFLKPFIKNIQKSYLIHFDLLPYVHDFFDFEFNILHIDITSFILLAVLLAISLLFLVLSHKNAKETFSKYSTLHIIPYFLLYYILLSFIATIALFEFFIGKVQKW